MKVSLEWMHYYSSVKLMPDGIDKLVDKIGAQLGAVEEVLDLGKRYHGIVISRVVTCVCGIILINIAILAKWIACKAILPAVRVPVTNNRLAYTAAVRACLVLGAGVLQLRAA